MAMLTVVVWPVDGVLGVVGVVGVVVVGVVVDGDAVVLDELLLPHAAAPTSAAATITRRICIRSPLQNASAKFVRVARIANRLPRAVRDSK
jgi:hypothetical protein